MNLGIALDESSRRIPHLQDIIKRQDDEIVHLRDISKAITGKIIPALPASATPRQDESEYADVKRPLWKRMKFGRGSNKDGNSGKKGEKTNVTRRTIAGISMP